LPDAVATRGTGPAQVYKLPKQVLWPVILTAAESMGLELVSGDKESGVMLARRGGTSFKSGENVTIFVDQAAEHHTQVEVVSKSAVVANVFEPNWATQFLLSIEKAIVVGAEP